MADYRRFVPTACHECVIDIEGWRHDRGGELLIGLIPTHIYHHSRSWRRRLEAARAGLHGRSDHFFIELMSREEVEEFVAALQEAADAVYGK
jgi:hypothetical protein